MYRCVACSGEHFDVVELDVDPVVEPGPCSVMVCKKCGRATRMRPVYPEGVEAKSRAVRLARQDCPHTVVLKGPDGYRCTACEAPQDVRYRWPGTLAYNQIALR